MNNKFAIGFIIGLLLFLAINLLAAQLTSDCGLAAFSPGSACADGIIRLGWPLQFFESGGFMYQQNFSLLSLMIDLGIGLALAALLGWLFARREKTLPK